jgi:hypothetical protein
MTPAESGADAALRARLAATPLREPAAERVRHWQATLRELPPPLRHGRWTDGPVRLDAQVPTLNPATNPGTRPTPNSGTQPATRSDIGPDIGPGTHPTLGPTSMRPQPWSSRGFTDPTPDPAPGPTLDLTTDPGADPAVDPITGPTLNPIARAITGPTLSPGTDAARDSALNPGTGPATDPVTDPALNPGTGPATDPTPRRTLDPATHPTPDPTLDPALDPAANGSDCPIGLLDGHALAATDASPEEGLRGDSESLTAAAKGLRSSGEGSAAIDGSAPSEVSTAPTDLVTAPTGDPTNRSGRSPSTRLRLIMSTPRPTSLSCARGAPSDGARGAANIGSGAAEQPAAMATEPLTMADTEMAVARIRHPKSPHVAAAIGWLAAAIVAVAVLDPTVLVPPVLTRAPSVATDTPTAAGPAVTPGTATPTTAGPAVTPGTATPIPGATGAGWPTDHVTGAPTDSPVRSSPDHPAGSEPLTLTHAQLLAGPPMGLASGPVDIPPTANPPGAPATRSTEPGVDRQLTPPTGGGVDRVGARDLGPLATPGILSACLARFGSGAQPVAARRVVLDGHAGVLLVLPTELPGRLRLLVVDPRCSSVISDDLAGR